MHLLAIIKTAFFLPPVHGLALLTVLFIAGICWQASGGLLILPIIVAMGASAIYFQKNNCEPQCIAIKEYAIHMLLAALFFFGGAYRYYQTAHAYAEFNQAITEKILDITGTINSIEKSNAAGYAHAITLVIDNVQQHQQKTHIAPTRNYVIKIYTPEQAQELRVGDIILCSNMQCDMPKNDHFVQYNIKEKITHTFFIKNPQITVLQRPKYSYNRTIHEYRQHITDQLRTKISPPCFALFSTIFLGSRDVDAHSLQTTQEHFIAWGIAHYLARSGLHLVLIIIMLMMLLRFLPLHFYLKQAIVIFIIMGYTCMTWFTISYLRSFLMFILSTLCMTLLIEVQLFHIVTLTALGILLENPFQLFFLDFQLSFALTAALAWYSYLNQYKKIKTLI
ncbi:MAG: ComEC/Rec2 family competence protein [Candidatus Babeliaceae bacterium]|jgi:competence protein ComEC